jgi:hypothetical protein
MFPPVPALFLEVGDGTARVALWLAGLGRDVAARPCASATRSEGVHRPPSPGVHCVVDWLPSLAVTCRIGLLFDIILLSE